ncbi:MAG TPA: thiamine-phosphate kinase [Nitrospirae bacterium]|nr:thiamine-phosphate kinase [Nitrospirota bacterium]
MKLGDAGELNVLERLRKRFPPASGDVIVGIGDDAAALDIDGHTLLLSTDVMTEGVHFDPVLFTPYQVGYKLVSSNVSDIFAMGGRPKWSLLCLTLPPETEEAFFEDFLDGVSDGLTRYGLELVGGDVTGSTGALTVSLAVAGVAGGKIIRRSGASAGERVYLSGPVGEASCGLEFLRRLGRSVSLEKGEELRVSPGWGSVEPLLRRLLLPEACDLSEYSEHITAMIDVSDGLFLDLTRLCRESSVGVRLYEERIPLTRELEEVSAFLGVSPYGFMTSGGEDYRQLFTSTEMLPMFAEIGETTEAGLRIVRSDGYEEEIRPEGYQHFVHK